jgi:hypothetical protein
MGVIDEGRVEVVSSGVLKAVFRVRITHSSSMICKPGTVGEIVAMQFLADASMNSIVLQDWSAACSHVGSFFNTVPLGNLQASVSIGCLSPARAGRSAMNCLA